MGTNPQANRRRAAGAVSVSVVGGILLVNGQPAAAADTFVVDNLSGDKTVPNSLPWAVDQAIDRATGPDLDTIEFDAGLTGTIELLEPLRIYDDLIITGPGEANLTITSAATSAVTDDVVYLYHGASLTLSGVTIDGATEHGVFSIAPPPGVDPGTLTLSNVTIRDSGFRGVRVDRSAGVTFDNVTLYGNDEEGASIRLSPFLDVTNSSLSGNAKQGLILHQVDTVGISDSVLSGNRSDGVLAYAQVPIDTDVTITRSTLSGNSGSGVVVANGSDLTVRDSELADNGRDGIVHYKSDVLVVENTTIARNTIGVSVFVADDVEITTSEITANQRGVVLDSVGVGSPSGNVTITRSTISSGTAGPAVQATVVPLGVDIESSTISGNDIGAGVGVVETDEVNLTVRHSTISANTSQSGVGQGAPPARSVFDLRDSDGPNIPTLFLDHSIVSDNDAFGLAPTGVTTVTANWSIVPVGTGLGGTTIESDAPGLGALAANGGPTSTMLPLAGSPALDAGDPAIVTPPAVDQRGGPRVDGVIDIGAVEIEEPIEAGPTDPGVIDIGPATVAVTETGGSVRLNVTRSGQGVGAATVQVMTASGTATSGSDFGAVSNLVFWSDGEVGAKVVEIPILADQIVEGNETFTVRIASPTGATLGTTTTATVTITDVPPANRPPVIQELPNRTLSRGGAVSTAFAVTDADNDAVTVTATSNDPNFVPVVTRVVGSSSQFVVTVSTNAAAVGPARITLTASDGTASTSTSFSVTIVSALLPATGSDATHHLSWFAGALIALGAALRGLGRRSSWRQRVAR